MWNSLSEFVRTIIGYWWALVPGVVIGGIGLWEWIAGQPLPVSLPAWLRFTIAVAALLIAAFLAFHKVRVERDASRNDKAEALDGLGNLLADGSQIRYRNVQSEDACREWTDDIRAWRQRTGQYVMENFSQAEALGFRNPGPAMAAHVSGSFNEAHNNNMLTVDLQLEILRDIIRRHST